MNSTEIQLPRKLTNQLYHQAQQTPELEVCGLIGSKNQIPCTCYPISNSAAQPETRFQLDAGEQIAAMVKMRENREQLFAIYHSHPTAPATPSTLDLQQATYPDALYLIISLNTKGILEMRGYKITDQVALEVALSLVEDES